MNSFALCAELVRCGMRISLSIVVKRIALDFCNHCQVVSGWSATRARFGDLFESGDVCVNGGTVRHTGIAAGTI